MENVKATSSLELMRLAMEKEYLLIKNPESLAASLKETIEHVQGLVDTNSKLSKGKLTLIQLDKLVHVIGRKFTLHPNLILLSQVPTYIKALILIDGLLKPFDIEVYGGYQNARISYIAESKLQTYYGFLDVARSQNPNSMLDAANHAAFMLYQHLALG